MSKGLNDDIYSKNRYTPELQFGLTICKPHQVGASYPCIAFANEILSLHLHVRMQLVYDPAGASLSRKPPW